MMPGLLEESSSAIVSTIGRKALSATGSDRGLDALLTLLRADAANVGLLRECVGRAFAERRFDVARELLDLRLAQSPADPMALFDAATLDIAEGNHAGAANILGHLAASGHRHPGVLINLGLCKYLLNDFDAARVSLQEAYAAGERSAGLLRLLVSSLHHVGSIDEAVEIAEQNPAPAQSDAALGGVYALVYLDADRALPAARWAKSSLQLNPNGVDALVVEGTLQIAGMRVGEAERNFKHALEIAPNTGRAWLGLGTLALLARDPANAKNLFDKALESLDQHVGTWHMLAWTHLTSGDLDAARTAFERALELNRNFAESHGGLAAVAAMSGNRAEAERSLEIARRLDPESLAAKLAGALLAANAGDAGAVNRLIAETATAMGSNANNALGRVLTMSAKNRR